MRFRFEAFDSAGNVISGNVEAATPDAARAVIRARGVTPYAVRGALSLGFLTREIGGRGEAGRLNDAEIARLARDVAVLLASGISLDATLRIAAAATGAARVEAAILRLLDGVLSGASLAGSMARMERTFQPEHIRIVEAGEMGASLAASLVGLADLLDRRVEIRAKVRAALAYPMLLVGLAFVSLWIVLGLLIPAVTPIFVENGKALPGILQVLDTIRRQAVPAVCVLAAVAGLTAFGVARGRRQPALARRIDRAFLSLPVVGRIAEARDAARFTRTLASLIKAGVAPLQALQAASPLVKNSHVRACLEEAVREVRAGAGIGASMTRAAVLPPVARQMIVVGEESGRMVDMLFRASAILESQDQLLTSRLVSIVTPLLTVLVSGVVGGVILSVMSAILSINDLAAQ